MEPTLYALGGVIYTLILCRVAIVASRVTDRPSAWMLGIVWPVSLFVVGFGVIISGSAGIYGEQR